ncbi:hypothetical protein [Mucilaginibacter phyllosphaerae]|uniref:Uncharacterized protein n=1 Tax=Mucilaginibacter phyllosphaerae TaxID=1812349 RepID=A0A4Y8AIX9_9SPHI|nr:hypothetical protein [Mucilaginibacter phyllosphaerae]MBB3967968.1 hypothetical protein [Mucilaginibacter phyllosphaerae]TEW69004.1 hypothetical protein E2R65_02225 [Mucilaginibacter phyllosphaerae]GGH02128.1 hypothetical protein GCM10007352_04190 [Mucilaginibacter phyllosphaerae]
MLKRYLLFFAGLLFLNHAFAQETVKKKYKLLASVKEIYSVLKSDGITRQGPYQALYNGKTVVATGEFNNDRQVGLWQFYNEKGVVVQTYNYTLKKLYFEAREDTTSHLRYFIDQVIDTAAITKPVKIGGIYYGYLPYLKLFKIPNDLAQIDRRFITAIVELLVSPGGRLADYKVTLLSNPMGATIRVVNMNLKLPNPDDLMFTPATLNGQPIACRIMMRCYVSDDGHLDFD